VVDERGYSMKKALLLFIVLGVLVVFFLASCATTRESTPEKEIVKEGKLHFNSGLAYGYDISGQDDRSFAFATETVKGEVYRNEKDTVGVNLGGGIIAGGTRKDKATYPMGGIMAEGDIVYKLSDVFSLYFGGYFGFMGVKRNLFGDSGFNGFGGGELGTEMWEKIRLALFLMHISDIPDTKGDYQLNVAGVKFTTDFEAISKAAKAVYRWIRGSKRKAPK
jgi:hypothetical protein